MVKSQAERFVPSTKLERLAHAFMSVSCTRSSARSELPQSESAKARKLGIARTRSSLSLSCAAIVAALTRLQPIEQVREPLRDFFLKRCRIGFVQGTFYETLHLRSLPRAAFRGPPHGITRRGGRSPGRRCLRSRFLAPASCIRLPLVAHPPPTLVTPPSGSGPLVNATWRRLMRFLSSLTASTHGALSR